MAKRETKETTKALAIIAPEPAPPARRVVGHAIQTNPLIGAIACVTPEALADIEQEIETTENYLAGLRAMHHVGSMALGLPVAPVVVQEPPAVEHEPEPEAEKPAPKPAKAKPAATEKPRGRPGLSGKLRAWLTAEPNLTNDDIIKRLKDEGVQKDDHSVRALAYNVRSQMKKESGAATPEAPKAQVQSNPNDGALRKQIAEHVFKKGLLSLDEIAKEFKAEVARVSALVTNHPWFEAHMGKWRLTYAGKNEAIDY